MLFWFRLSKKKLPRKRKQEWVEYGIAWPQTNFGNSYHHPSKLWLVWICRVDRTWRYKAIPDHEMRKNRTLLLGMLKLSEYVSLDHVSPKIKLPWHWRVGRSLWLLKYMFREAFLYSADRPDKTFGNKRVGIKTRYIQGEWESISVMHKTLHNLHLPSLTQIFKEKPYIFIYLIALQIIILCLAMRRLPKDPMMMHCF